MNLIFTKSLRRSSYDSRQAHSLYTVHLHLQEMLGVASMSRSWWSHSGWESPGKERGAEKAPNKKGNRRIQNLLAVNFLQSPACTSIWPETPIIKFSNVWHYRLLSSSSPFPRAVHHQRKTDDGQFSFSQTRWRGKSASHGLYECSHQYLVMTNAAHRQHHQFHHSAFPPHFDAMQCKAAERILIQCNSIWSFQSVAQLSRDATPHCTALQSFNCTAAQKTHFSDAALLDALPHCAVLYCKPEFYHCPVCVRFVQCLRNDFPLGEKQK